VGTFLAQQEQGADMSSPNKGVGHNHPLHQLRVECREKHNSIFGYDFCLLSFNWGLFVKIMTHQLAIKTITKINLIYKVEIKEIKP
jgi:hypothetical protein